MIIEVKVPQLCESVSEGTLVAWKKKVGEAVADGVERTSEGLRFADGLSSLAIGERILPRLRRYGRVRHHAGPGRVLRNNFV